MKKLYKKHIFVIVHLFKHTCFVTFSLNGKQVIYVEFQISPHKIFFDMRAIPTSKKRLFNEQTISRNNMFSLTEKNKLFMWDSLLPQKY